MALLANQLVACLVLVILGYTLFKGKGAFAALIVSVAAQIPAVLYLVAKAGVRNLYGEPHSYLFYAKYQLLAGLIALALALVLALATRHITLRWQPRPLTWKNWAGALVFFALGLFTGTVAFASLWVSRNFGYNTPDSIRFFLTGTNVGDLTTEMKSSIAVQVIAPTLLFALICLLAPIFPFKLNFPHARRIKEWPVKIVRRVAKLSSVAAMASALAAACMLLPIVQTIRADFETSTLVEDNYVEPTAQIMHFPAKPKNLVHFVLESMENSYYSKSEGGYLGESLMPELAELTKEGVSFSHTEKFGGPHQVPGATHSVAGILNTQTGVPMVPVQLTNNWTMSYSDLPNIAHLLHEHGYQNSYMLGGRKGFHQMGSYFEEYADFKMFDHDTAIERHLIPADYDVFWGVEDDKLYEYAKTELTNLGSGDQPFFFLLENADTHHPKGYLSPRATEFPSDKHYGNVIHYSQQEVVKLVRWMQDQPWYKDTVILITGDHLSKDTEFFQGWDEGYERTVVNVILNGAQPQPEESITHNRDYATFDFCPTIAAAMGIQVDGDRLGIGTNLYSGKKTLMEELGVEKVREELNKRSRFYEKHLIPEITQKEIQDHRS